MITLLFYGNCLFNVCLLPQMVASQSQELCLSSHMIFGTQEFFSKHRTQSGGVGAEKGSMDISDINTI